MVGCSTTAWCIRAPPSWSPTRWRERFGRLMPRRARSEPGWRMRHLRRTQASRSSAPELTVSSGKGSTLLCRTHREGRWLPLSSIVGGLPLASSWSWQRLARSMTSSLDQAAKLFLRHTARPSNGVPAMGQSRPFCRLVGMAARPSPSSSDPMQQTPCWCSRPEDFPRAAESPPASCASTTRPPNEPRALDA